MDKAIQQQLFEITGRINQGITLDEILDYMYDSFHGLIPFDRISLALLDDDQQTLQALWVRSDLPQLELDKGYSADITKSSLQEILKTGEPRIMTDLEQYAAEHRDSAATRKILSEGIRSSLTCPLIALGKPIGFIFFSSVQTNTYTLQHRETFMAIAAQVAMIAEKSRLYHQLKELNELKNKFIGIAAHDLKSPLGSLVLYADALKGEMLGPLNEKQMKFVRLMSEICEKMQNLINDLLSVSLIESNQVKINKREVDLNAFIREIYERQRLLAQAKKIDMVLNMPDSLPPMSVDPHRIEQVLNNILSNAIKYSYPESVITLEVVPEKDELIIAVKDQGQGIPEKDMPKLFEFFSKASPKPTAGESSTGLGLAIAKKMIEAHGGRIWVQSQPQQGSTFFVSLPRESLPAD